MDAQCSHCIHLKNTRWNDKIYNFIVRQFIIARMQCATLLWYDLLYRIPRFQALCTETNSLYLVQLCGYGVLKEAVQVFGPPCQCHAFSPFARVCECVSDVTYNTSSEAINNSPLVYFLSEIPLCKTRPRCCRGTARRSVPVENLIKLF